MKFRIKEYTNKYGSRKYLVQRKRTFLWFSWWTEACDWHSCDHYSLRSALNALSYIKIAFEQCESNSKLPTKYHEED